MFYFVKKEIKVGIYMRLMSKNLLGYRKQTTFLGLIGPSLHCFVTHT